MAERETRSAKARKRRKRQKQSFDRFGPSGIDQGNIPDHIVFPAIHEEVGDEKA